MKNTETQEIDTRVSNETPRSGFEARLQAYWLVIFAARMEGSDSDPACVYGNRRVSTGMAKVFEPTSL